MSISEFVFGGVRARLDEIIFVSVEMEDFLAIAVHDFFRHGI